MLLPNDVVYQILLLLPVMSLLRFKLVCRTWRALIGSNDFIKQHLHCHHRDSSLKYKSSSLIHLAHANGPPFTFPLVPIDSFDEPNACVQLNSLELPENSRLVVSDVASYNGIVCLKIVGCSKFVSCKGKPTICLWNPATRQSRFLQQLPTPTPEMRYNPNLTLVGIGFDVENNDYKVVNLCINSALNEERVDVYSLNTDSWRSVATDFPVIDWLTSPMVDSGMPFNNGTCFFWYALDLDSKCMRILCFDFISGKFRAVSFSSGNYHTAEEHYATVLSDDIAYVSIRKEDQQTEIWVFKEYGSVNESWVKLHTIYPYSSIDLSMSVKCLSMNGKYLFFNNARGRIVRYDVVTKETKNLPTIGNREEVYKDRPIGLPTICFLNSALVEFKESLLSFGKGNNESEKKRKRNDNRLNV